MAAVEMQVDTRELQKAMQLYARATRKDEVDIVNETVRKAIWLKPYGVYHNTKLAEPEKIKAKLNSTKWHGVSLKYLLAAKKLKSAKKSDLVFTKTGKRSRAKKHIRSWEERVADEAESIVRRRVAAAGYLRAGWKEASKRGNWSKTGAAKKFKGKIGSATRPTDRGKNPVFAEFSNHVSFVKEPGVGAEAALRRAIRGRASDMASYARKKMARTARKYSAK